MFDFCRHCWGCGFLCFVGCVRFNDLCLYLVWVLDIVDLCAFLGYLCLWCVWCALGLVVFGGLALLVNL